MILALDVGNTFAKWGFIQAGAVIAGGRVLHREVGLSTALEPLNLDRHPETIVAVNVAGPAAVAALAAWAKQRFALPVCHVDARSPHPALRTLYTGNNLLGADRWAAVVGAFLTYGACVVADLGTAATVDWVDAKGTHRGGYVVPGIDAMRMALAAGTHGVKVEDVDVAPGTWGIETSAAVAAGARRALAALIESATRERGAVGATLVLTGGDADRVAPWLGCHHQIDHDIVLRGAVALAEASAGAGK